MSQIPSATPAPTSQCGARIAERLDDIDDAVAEHDENQSGPADHVEQIEDQDDAGAVLAKGRFAEIDLLDAVALAAGRERCTDQEHADQVAGDQAHHALHRADQLRRVAAGQEAPGRDGVGKTGAVCAPELVLAFVGKSGSRP